MNCVKIENLFKNFNSFTYNTNEVEEKGEKNVTLIISENYFEIYIFALAVAVISR